MFVNTFPIYVFIGMQISLFSFISIPLFLKLKFSIEWNNPKLSAPIAAIYITVVSLLSQTYQVFLKKCTCFVSNKRFQFLSFCMQLFLY